MATRLNVLIVEDNAHDVSQVVQKLCEAGCEFDFKKVRTGPLSRRYTFPMQWQFKS